MSIPHNPSSGRGFAHAAAEMAGASATSDGAELPIPPASQALYPAIATPATLSMGRSPSQPSRTTTPMDRSRSTPNTQAGSTTPHSPRCQPTKRTVEDFTFGRILGEGSYSTVMVGTEKDTGKEYAVKILDKRHIIKEKKSKYVNIERDTLSRLSHPFVVRLHYAFQDSASLYFVLDLARNGELLSLIRQVKQFPEEGARFYLAEIIVAVEYLHSKNVIHRDLKPENILLDEAMHIKLTDFGTAKLTDNTEQAPATPSQRRRANSFVGTAEYVSPELLTDKAVDKSSDLWALGCIFYQLLAGRPPFKGGNEYQTFQKIIRLEYALPDYFSPEARDLITQLLVLDPSQRIGATDSDLQAIKDHPFFAGFQWDGLQHRTPPTLVTPGANHGWANSSSGEGPAQEADTFVDDTDLFQRLQNLPEQALQPVPLATFPAHNLQHYALSSEPKIPVGSDKQASSHPDGLSFPTAASPPPLARHAHDTAPHSPPGRHSAGVMAPQGGRFPPLTSPPPPPMVMSPPFRAHHGGRPQSYYDFDPSQSSISYSSTQSPPDPNFHNLHHCEAPFNEGGKLAQSAKPWTLKGRVMMALANWCPCFCCSSH
ncbi:serine/threonine protein kinase [Dimargaris xerosporica]|nr:serine/threonine protein kinase [Dimargaris xerosporica]